MKRNLLIVGMLALVISLSAVAADTENSSGEKVKNVPETYVAPMGMQFMRGIVNTGTGWGEIPRQIILTGQEDCLCLALPLGLPRGIVMTVVRTFYGVMETAFFFIPFGGENYESAMKPAYVWQKAPQVEEEVK